MKDLKKLGSKVLSCFLIATISFLCSCTSVQETSTESTATAETIDFTNIRPQDDFYGYVVGAELSEANITYYDGNEGSFEVAQKNVESVLREAFSQLLERYANGETFEVGSKEDILLKAYLQRVEFLSSSDDDIARIQAAEDVEAMANDILNATTIEELLATMSILRTDYSVDSFIGLGISDNYYEQNQRSVSFNSVYFVAGVSLQDIDEFPNNASTMKEPVMDFLEAFGIAEEEAQETTRSLGLLAIDITNNTDIELMKDSTHQLMFERMNFYSYDELDEIFTNVDCRDIERYSGITNNPYGGWMIDDINQARFLNEILIEENLPALKAWVLYDFIYMYGSCIVNNHNELVNYFTRINRSPEEQAIYDIFYNDTYAQEVSAFYTETFYTEEMEATVRLMCEQIREAYRQKILGSTWLSEETRNGLIQKLDNIDFVTGGNVSFDVINVEKSTILDGNYWESTLAMNRFCSETSIARIGTPLDRTEPRMTMQEVNACYVPANLVTITVGIMSEPLFSVDYDYYTNLGLLGAAISHEVGHAFDSNMLVFDSNGEYNPGWISEADWTILEARNQSAIEYFENAFSVFDVYHINGANTLGENYADLGGLEVLMLLCTTDDERRTVLENYVRTFSEIISDTDLLQQIARDVHSPSMIRTNAVVATIPEFYEVYDINEGDPMYIAPENRISRW